MAAQLPGPMTARAMPGLPGGGGLAHEVPAAGAVPGPGA